MLLLQLRPLPAGPEAIATPAVTVEATAAAGQIAEVEILDLTQHPQPIGQTTPRPTPLPPPHHLPPIVTVARIPTQNPIGRITLLHTVLLAQLLLLMDLTSSGLLEVVVSRVEPLPALTRDQTQDSALLRLVRIPDPTLPRPVPTLDPTLPHPVPTRDPTPAQAHGPVRPSPTGQTLRQPTYPTLPTLLLPSLTHERVSVPPTLLPKLPMLHPPRPLLPLPAQHQHLKKDTLDLSLFLPMFPCLVRPLLLP